MPENLNSNKTKPNLNPDNLIWLTEMGISYGLLKTYSPKAIEKGNINKNNNKTQAVISNTDKKIDLNKNKNIAHSPEAQTTFKNILNQPVNTKSTHTAPESTAAPESSLINSKTDEINTTDLDKLYELALKCEECQLHKQRDKLVFGFGHKDSPDLMIIGEAPGRADDANGYPFQGKAGKLLHFMLLSIGLYPNGVNLGPNSLTTTKQSAATNIYFTNLVKCRPVGNRSPSDVEIKSCYSFLKTQIDIIKPKAILLMGSLAAKSLLDPNKSLDQLRAKINYVKISELEIPVVATWHPASLLLQPQNKPLAWEDLQLVKTLV